ncbi:MAG: cysteine desulfurase NifS [Firmicutes bacterium HGW-Firmicutes-7]|nr:MAG: cysteine desulfurase NifS [Firmicutes bacterium HGW-Firmicutes-7]
MIYLDYNATTPIDKAVTDAMLPFIYENYGNPSSSHQLGTKAKSAVEEAREKIAELLNCNAKEIIFTSGGSEANNTVIKGVAYTYRYKGDHIITSQIEHPAVLNPCKHLEQLGYKISYLPVDEYGVVIISELEKLITNKTILVTIMHANNETGSIQPIEDISKICRKNNILFHTDAAQSIGKIPTNVEELGVDFLTIAGHKLYAPKGIGALYIRKGIAVEPLIHGANHESGQRAGTENVIFDVALGKACEIAKETLTIERVKQLTDDLYLNLKSLFGDQIILNGHPDKRLPNTLNVSFLGYQGAEILARLGDDVAASTGSACHSGSIAISPVLKAMKVSEDVGRGAIRFSLGRYTTEDEINIVINRFKSMAIN